MTLSQIAFFAESLASLGAITGAKAQTVQCDRNHFTP